MQNIPSFLITELLQGYRSGAFTVTDVVDAALERIEQTLDRNIWITRLSREQLLKFARELEGKSRDLPLYGIPFAIKDNIDLAGILTTAACPDYAFKPERSATVVEKLIAAGAIPIGKTNLDQFATGLVGTRSPYGICRNAFNPKYISGGSSSGSSVAVAMGCVSFALGTDTAGSGRIPAGFNNLVGCKPSLGRLSTRGVLPACRTLDCVSILTLTSEDAAVVLSAAEGFDAEDPYSSPRGDQALTATRYGVPRLDQLEFGGDAEYARLFAAAVSRVRTLGGEIVEIDASPFFETARLLYDGPWIAERYAAISDFIEQRPGSLHPVTRAIIQTGAEPSAADAFRAQYRLAELRRAAESAWTKMDVLLVPTAPTIYEVAQLEADPIRLNSSLGYYTNFVNLMDLAAVAVPAGFRGDQMPFGVTIIGRAGTDKALLRIGASLHRAFLDPGALAIDAPVSGAVPDGFMAVAVCGAHMQGLPLNAQLRDRGGFLLRSTRTAPKYRFYALPGSPPRRPGLIRVAEGGAPIDVEVWAIRAADFGSFVAGIPAPLGIGKVELEDGAIITGFVCEGYASQGAEDITALGGWRAWISQQG